MPPEVGVNLFSPNKESPRSAIILWIPKNLRLYNSLSISSVDTPAQMICGTISTSYSDMMTPQTVSGLTLFLTRCLLKEPSGFCTNWNSSLWHVTLMYLGLNSINWPIVESNTSELQSPDHLVC